MNFLHEIDAWLCSVSRVNCVCGAMTKNRKRNIFRPIRTCISDIGPCWHQTCCQTGFREGLLYCSPVHPANGSFVFSETKTCVRVGWVSWITVASINCAELEEDNINCDLWGLETIISLIADQRAVPVHRLICALTDSVQTASIIIWLE